MHSLAANPLLGWAHECTGILCLCFLLHSFISGWWGFLCSPFVNALQMWRRSAPVCRAFCHRPCPHCCARRPPAALCPSQPACASFRRRPPLRVALRAERTSTSPRRPSRSNPTSPRGLTVFFADPALPHAPWENGALETNEVVRLPLNFPIIIFHFPDIDVTHVSQLACQGWSQPAPARAPPDFDN